MIRLEEPKLEEPFVVSLNAQCFIYHGVELNFQLMAVFSSSTVRETDVVSLKFDIQFLVSGPVGMDSS